MKNNHVGKFITDRCIKNGNHSVFIGELYECYRDWAYQNKIMSISKRKFIDALYECGFTDSCGPNNKRMIVGIALLDNTINQLKS